MTEPTQQDERELVRDNVNKHDTGPSERDEMEILRALYKYDEGIGIFYESKFDDDDDEED